MKILISGYHNPKFKTITEYIENAISELGHKIAIFDDWNVCAPVPRRVQKILPFLEPLRLKKINKALLNLVKKENPDLCLIAGGTRILPETIKLIKSRKIKTVLWTIDAPIEFESIIKAAPFYDFVFCGGSEAV